MKRELGSWKPIIAGWVFVIVFVITIGFLQQVIDGGPVR